MPVDNSDAWEELASRLAMRLARMSEECRRYRAALDEIRVMFPTRDPDGVTHYAGACHPSCVAARALRKDNTQ